MGDMSVNPFEGKALVEKTEVACVGGGGFGTEGDCIEIRQVLKIRRENVQPNIPRR